MTYSVIDMLIYFCCIYCRMTLGAVASVILALGGAAVFSSLHKIEEGHVGVYYRSVF